MKYLIAILILVVVFGLYITFYILNSKVKKPENCEEIECSGCNLNCNKRR